MNYSPALLPEAVHYSNGTLTMDQTSLSTIAAELPTPFYCYSQTLIEHKVSQCKEAFLPLGASIHFAVKANSNLSVLQLMADSGLGADIVSGGELVRALEAGIPAEQIIYSGVAKTDREIRLAIEAGVGQFNLESAEELDRINRLATELEREVVAVLRVNPDVDAGTHRHITTGKKGNKFGICSSLLETLFTKAAEMPYLQIRGLAMHIGSQICQLDPYREAMSRMRSWVTELRQQGFTLDRLDLGGGVGVNYGEDMPFSFADYAALVKEELSDLDIRLQIEPGRSLVAEAGVLVTSVVNTKQASPNSFVMLDAGMNDLMRPALYQATHHLLPVCDKAGQIAEQVDVVGPVCESTDCFLRNYHLPQTENGELMAFTMAGAYSAVLASSYNSRSLVAEVLVSGDQHRIIRRAWDIAEQLMLER